MTGQADFVRDDPDSLSDDAFGHSDYADALVSILRSGSPPPTVGVFGPWGVGKSTIIGGVQKALQPTEVAFVYFDVWRYEGDSLRRQFLTEVARQLAGQGRLKDYNLEDELRELEVDTQELRETFSWNRERFKRAVALGLVFGVIALLMAMLGGVTALLGGNFGTKLLGALTVFAVTTVASALSQSVVVTPTTFTRHTLKDPDRFAAKFTKVLSCLRTDRLIVAVDNLDRCSPEKAVEMLGTIKTYLEPAVANDDFPSSRATKTVDKDIVFVIAVDDAALRRHLIAKERERSAGQDDLAVRRYVDEYLAKFFNARLPIRSILADDMRSYIDAHIRPLAVARGLEPTETQTLIGIVAAALRRNPRGIKQFRNDLESRLRLLEEREKKKKNGKKGIDPPVSGEVAMIAKLALIEAEWPDAFAQLQADPRLLEHWTAQAVGETEVDWTPAEERHTGEQDDSLSPPRSAAETRARRAFGEFFRFSASTTSDHLMAMLSLKQSEIELALPGHSKFREALINGDRDLVEEVIRETDDDQRGNLAGRVPSFLREELQTGYLDSARVIVDVVISIDAFTPLDSVRREVLEIAVEDPRLRTQLLSLDPATVLAQSKVLPLKQRQGLFEPYINRLLTSSLANHLRQPIAEAIGSWTGDFSATQHSRVREAITRDMKSEYTLYLPLARTQPSLLSPQVVSAALNDLEQHRGGEPYPEQPPPLSERPEPLEVLELGLRDITTEQEAQIVGLITRIISTYAEQEQALGADLAIYGRLLGQLEIAQEDIWSELSRAIESHWTTIPESLRTMAFVVADVALTHADEGTRDEVARSIASSIFENPEAGLAFAEQIEKPPPSLEHAFVAHLTSLSGQPNYWRASSHALARINGPDYPRWQINALHHLLNENHPEAAREMLELFDKVFSEHADELAEAITPLLIERANNDQRTPPDLLIPLTEVMSDEQIERLAVAYADRLAGPETAQVAELLEELHQQAATQIPLRVAHHAITRLGTDPQPPPGPQLLAVCRYAGQLPAEDQRLLAASLANRLRTHLDQAADVAGYLGHISGFAAEPSKEIVAALIDAETAVQDPSARQALLSAANALRGRTNSQAAKALRKRLETLIDSESEFDQELGKKFLALIDS